MFLKGKYDLYILILPLWLWDHNSANVCPCACRKGPLIVGYKLSYTTGYLYA